MQAAGFGLSFPLRWKLATRLPTFGEALPEVLTWPEGPWPVLEAFREEIKGPHEWGKDRTHLLFAECSEAGELLALAVALAKGGGAGLAIVSGEAASEEARGQAVTVSPWLRCVVLGGREETLEACARATDELLRRQLARVLLDELHMEQARLGCALPGTLYDVSSRSPAAKPRIPPMESLLSAHARAVRGVWWWRRRKDWSCLGVAEKTAARWRRLAPQGVEAARRLTVPPLRVWLVVDEPLLPQRRWGASLGLLEGFDVEARAFSRPEAARRAMLEQRPPDVLLVDLPRVRAAGETFVPWLSDHAPRTVVLCCGCPSPAMTRGLYEAGAFALSVAGFEHPSATAALMLRGVRAAARLQALELNDQLREALRRDLAPMFPLVGSPGASLGVIEAAAFEHAMRRYPTREEAAAALGCSSKTIYRRQKAGFRPAVRRAGTTEMVPGGPRELRSYGRVTPPQK